MLLGAVGALLLSVYLHFFSPAARELVRVEVLAFLNPTLRGDIGIEEIARLTPRHIVVEGITVRAPDGREVVALDRVEVWPDLLALVRGTIGFGGVSIRGGLVRLLTTEDGGLAIAAAFEPTEPTPEDDAPPTPVRIDELAVDDLAVEVPDLPFGVQELRLRASLALVETLSLHILEGGAALVGDEAAAALAFEESRLRLGPGERSNASLVLTTGGDRIAVTAEARLPDEDVGHPLAFDARVRLDPLSNATLRWAGLEDPPLAGPVRGEISAKGTPSAASLAARIRTPGGPVSLDAHLRGPERLEIALATENLALDELLADGPSMRVGGRVEADVRSLADAPRRVRVEARDLRVDEFALPTLLARAVVEEDAIVLEELRAPSLHGSLALEGRVGFDGSADVRLDARAVQLGREPNVRRLMPSLAGRLDARVHARIPAENARGEMSVRGEVALEGFRYEDIAIGKLRLTGNARGERTRPIVDAQLSTRSIRIDTLALEHVDLALRGGPERFAVRADVGAPGRRAIHGEGRVHRDGETFRTNLDVLAIGIADRQWRGRIENLLFVPGDRVEIGSATLASGEERIGAEGTYRFDGPMELRATLQHVGLDIATVVPGVDELPARGFVDLFVDVRGTVERPDAVVQGALYEGAVQGVPITLAALYGEFRGGEGELAADLDVELAGNYGAAAVSVTGSFDPKTRDRGQALEKGRYAIEAEATRISARLFEVLRPEQPPPYTGIVSGTFRADGTLEDPRLWAAIEASELGMEGVGPFTFAFETSYEDESFRTYAAVGDQRGLIAIADVDAGIDLPRLARDPARAMEMLAESRVRATVDMPPRRVDELPPPLWSGGEMPAFASLALFVDHAPQQPTRADFSAELDWTRLPEPSPLASLGACDAEAIGPALFVSASLRQGEVNLRTYGTLDRRRVLEGEARTTVDIDRLLAGQPHDVPSVDAEMRLAGISLERVPGVCEFAAGPLEGKLVVQNLFTDDPRVTFDVVSPELRTPQAEPIRIELGASLTREEARARVNVESRRATQGMSASAFVPMRWVEGGPLPVPAESRLVEADVQLREMPLGPLLAPVPDVGFAGGVANGRMRLRGTLDEPRLSGSIAVWDATVSLLATGQRFDGIRGLIELDDRRVKLSRLQARDGGGRIDAQGEVALEGFTPRNAELQVRTRSFPVRQAGVVVATITANANVRAVLGEERTEAFIELDDVGVGLRDVTPPRLQSLDAHPEVVVVGARLPDDEERLDDPGRPAILRVTSTRNFWVRRHDLAAQMEADLTVHFEDEVRVTGQVRLYRGFFELAGRRFELREGELQFTGGEEIDPIVRLLAVNEFAPGETVTITITGRAQRPQLAFTGPRGEPLTAGEAVARLMGGRRGQPQGGGLETEAAAVLSSFTAGVLTTTLRRELGDLAPIIVIEPGTAPGATRLRAGIAADRIIPRALRGVVRGAYVEGFVSTPGAAGEASGAAHSPGNRGGFLIELLFPRDIVTTVQFAPPTNWSADFMWQP